MTAGVRTARRGGRYRHPPLILVAVGAGVVLALLTGFGLVSLVGAEVASAGLNALSTADRAMARSFVHETMRASDLADELPADRAVTLNAALARLVSAGEIRAVAVYGPHGFLLAHAGTDGMPNVSTSLAQPDSASVTLQGSPPLVAEQVPVLVDGASAATIRIERNGSALTEAVARARLAAAVVLTVAALLLTTLLVFMLRSTQSLLTRQAEALIESSTRDRGTGLPSHGSSVEALTSLVADARREQGWLLVALLDIDGFELFNSTHGHTAGDQVLSETARIIDEEAPAGALVGRYGPDEFVIAGAADVAAEIRPAIARIQARLRDWRVGPGDGTHVPVTISAGVATYPEHAASVSELLASATMTLREARVSGGDTVCVDAPGGTTPDELIRNFGVLQGLVTAVDTKDHYTKRHSEEVAHYAMTVAMHMGLDAPFVAAVRQAGLLHDVGKIAVPDAILRKPAPLTEEEWVVMRQHTVVGDLIVGALPNLELVRAGVRHHHERWDGAGYPDGLRGDVIPRIARVIAVADAFSAMTTTRSYRAALPVAEAMRRLVEAAGSQLDPDFVAPFIELLHERPELISAGGDPTPARLWRFGDAFA